MSVSGGLVSICRHETTISRYIEDPGVTDPEGRPAAVFADDGLPTLGFVQADRKSKLPDPLGGVDVVIVDYTVFYPAEVAIADQDRIKWGSRVLRILRVLEEQAPGFTHHLKVSCLEVNDDAVYVPPAEDEAFDYGPRIAGGLA